ncbi:MAG: hypothetical protein JRI65_14725, partial [Deltaproteobacteria bacterium]|nr:hypothetical protein [Deltaproteobacteria bacterium]
SDRFCEKWRQDYGIDGLEHLDLHHLYRAMGFLGRELEEEDIPYILGVRMRQVKRVIH